MEEERTDHQACTCPQKIVTPVILRAGVRDRKSTQDVGLGDRDA
jgi:hypothetical protein